MDETESALVAAEQEAARVHGEAAATGNVDETAAAAAAYREAAAALQAHRLAATTHDPALDQTVTAP